MAGKVAKSVLSKIYFDNRVYKYQSSSNNLVNINSHRHLSISDLLRSN